MALYSPHISPITLPLYMDNYHIFTSCLDRAFEHQSQTWNGLQSELTVFLSNPPIPVCVNNSVHCACSTRPLPAFSALLPHLCSVSPGHAHHWDQPPQLALDTFDYPTSFTPWMEVFPQHSAQLRSHQSYGFISSLLCSIES